MAVSPDRQLVIFSADSERPTLADLAGLLMGPGQVSRMGGTARVSIRVGDAWRVHALAAEFAARGLAISWEQADDGGYWVRTSYSSTLVRLDAPSFLDGLRLRLWFISAGELEAGEEQAVVLGLGQSQALARPALAPLGLDGEVVKGPAIRIAGEAKRRRLADLIGERPPRAPSEAWPASSKPRPQASPGAARHPSARPRRHDDADALELWPVDPGGLPEITAGPADEVAEAPKARPARSKPPVPAGVGDLAARRRARAAGESTAGAPKERRARAS